MSAISDKTQELEKNYHFNFYRRASLTLIQGHGTKVFDTEGKEYLDALAGIAVNVLGHAHPKVVAAIKDQAEKLIHVSNIYYNVPQSSLAKILTELARLDKIFFCNSGAEANEGAIKLVRKYAYKKGRSGNIISFSNCFHGRTIATVAMGQSKYQQGFQPMPEGFRQFPFNDLDYFQKNVGDDTIGVFIEPIQGEGGINPVDKEFFEGIAKICREKDILLVCDEIQCGMGRSGKFLAAHHYNVQPDIVTLAKGLGGGVPIGAVLAKEGVASAFDPGDHGTTFGGNPLACAVAFEILKVITQHDLINRAARLGEWAIDKLNTLKEKYPVIKEVRGKGLMIGIQIDGDGKKVVGKMMEMGVLANSTANNTIRFLPPFIIQKDEFSQVIKIFESALKSITHE